MMVGYARVSSQDQDVGLQRALLEAHGCERLFSEVKSAGKRRPVLERMLYCLRRGDVLVVYKLDRLARSLTDLLRILDRLSRLEVGLRSLTESVDTTTAAGRMIVQLLGTFAEFERSLIRERSMAGQDRAYSAGVKFGRRRAFDADTEEAIYQRWKRGDATRSELAAELGGSYSAVVRVILRRESPGASAVRSRWRECRG